MAEPWEQDDPHMGALTWPPTLTPPRTPPRTPPGNISGPLSEIYNTGISGLARSGADITT